MISEWVSSKFTCSRFVFVCWIFAYRCNDSVWFILFVNLYCCFVWYAVTFRLDVLKFRKRPKIFQFQHQKVSMKEPRNWNIKYLAGTEKISISNLKVTIRNRVKEANAICACVLRTWTDFVYYENRDYTKVQQQKKKKIIDNAKFLWSCGGGDNLFCECLLCMQMMTIFIFKLWVYVMGRLLGFCSVLFFFEAPASLNTHYSLWPHSANTNKRIQGGGAMVLACNRPLVYVEMNAEFFLVYQSSSEEFV